MSGREGGGEEEGEGGLTLVLSKKPSIKPTAKPRP